MLFEPKYFKQAIGVIYSTNYKRNYKTLLFTMRLSRLPVLKKNSYFLALYQFWVIGSIAHLQDVITSLNKEIKKKKEENKDIKSDLDTISQLKEILRIIYTINDGVVARVIGFDRPILRLLSENRQLGYLKKDEYDNVGLLKTLALNYKQKGIRLISDITRYLRIGDVILVDNKGKIFIYEVKTDKKTKKSVMYDVGKIFNDLKKNSDYPNRQNERHIIAQMAIIERVINVPMAVKSGKSENTEVNIIDIQLPVKHHLGRIRKALKESKKKIISLFDIEEGYGVAILRNDKIEIDDARSIFSKFKETAPTWFRKNDVNMFRISSLETFISEDGEFARNIFPYSVFPFSSEDCLKLMSGEIYIEVFLDISKIRKRLEEKGWKVEEGDFIEELRSDEPYTKKKGKGLMYSYADPVLFKISKDIENSSLVYKGQILATQVFSAMFSFYSVDFIVDVVEEQFRISNPGESRFVTHNYVGEKKLYL